MGLHPINLALRLFLELTALFGLGAWGWRAAESPVRFLWAAGLPLVAAALWGTFAVPEDPSRSDGAPVPVPGALRLAIELAVLGLGGLALLRAGFEGASVAFGVLVVLHYAASHDRIAWLLRS